MIRNILLLIFLFSFSFLAGQNSEETHSKVRISMEGKNIQDLLKLGFGCCGMHLSKGEMVESVFSSAELQLLKDHGWEYEMLIENMTAHYLANSDEPVNFRNACDGNSAPLKYPIPDNFEMGSLGGFLTYQETLNHLDSMAAKYPNLITIKKPIGPILTHDGNPIYWIKISDNPNQNEAEPEVFFNAIHHAREPAGLIQLIYYMWYLLENYEDNPEMQYLVDNTEMYFVPIVNPDGYLYNEANYNNSGGNIFWRKNRRNNGDGSFGVDLNRNYGYEWAHNNNGSSPNTSSETYRGTAPFSEPETQNIRDFCNAHEFQITMNYHSYGNLLIYPWGYSDTPTIDGIIFNNMAEAMTRENDYFAGTGMETVGYNVNGNSDDWMYGEQITKPASFSMTPEVGQSFWPARNSILDIIQETVQQNLTTAHLALNMGLATINKGINTVSTIGNIEYDLKKYGLQDGPLTVSLAGISSNVLAVGEAKTYNLTIGQNIIDGIGYALTEDIAFGEAIEMELLIDNGKFIRRDTLTAIYEIGIHTGTTLLSDNADDISNWNIVGQNSWNATTEAFVSSASSLTDSPNQDYSSNRINIMELANVVDLTTATDARLDFWAKWEIEVGWDFAQVLLSSDGQNWTPACGDYSVLGNSNQDYNEPLYDGNQNSWVKESIDLSDYIGGSLYVRFLMLSDGAEERDGFYVDDIEVIAEGEFVQTIEIDNNDFVIYQNKPNPASNFTIIELDNIASLQNAKLTIHNTIGQKVYQAPVANDLQTLKLNTASWAPGVYFYRVETGEEVTKTMRMEVVR